MFIVLLIEQNKVEQQDSAIGKDDAVKLAINMVLERKSNLFNTELIEQMLMVNSYYHGMAHGKQFALQLVWIPNR